MLLRSKALAPVVLLAAGLAASRPAWSQPRSSLPREPGPALCAKARPPTSTDLAPAQAARLVALATTGQTDAAVAADRPELRKLRRRLGVSDGAVLAMLRTLGEGAVPIEGLPRALADLTDRHKDLLGRLSPVEGGDPGIARARSEAFAAVERGEFAAADRFLGYGEDAALRAAGRSAAAEGLAERARVAALRIRPAEAGRLFREAADLVPEAEPLRRADYLRDAGRSFRDAGSPAEAERAFQGALDLRERALGPGHPEFAAALDALAATRRDLGRPGDAEKPHRRALAILERALGPEHPEVATALEALATTLCAVGHPGEAEPLRRRALPIWKRALGPSHPEFAAALAGLADVLDDLRRPSEAEPLRRRALATLERTLGPDHPEVGAAVHDLAVTLRGLGRAAEAEPLHRRALAIWESGLGPDHPYVVRSLDSLAAVLRDLGRTDEAGRLQRRAADLGSAASRQPAPHALAAPDRASAGEAVDIAHPGIGGRSEAL